MPTTDDDLTALRERVDGLEVSEDTMVRRLMRIEEEAHSEHSAAVGAIGELRTRLAALERKVTGLSSIVAGGPVHNDPPETTVTTADAPTESRPTALLREQHGAGFPQTVQPGQAPESRPAPPDDAPLVEALRNALNRHSAENGSNTPDFVLADFLAVVLAAFNSATRQREQWYGVHHRPGGPAAPSVPTAPSVPVTELEALARKWEKEPRRQQTAGVSPTLTRCADDLREVIARATEGQG